MTLSRRTALTGAAAALVTVPALAGLPAEANDARLRVLFDDLCQKYDAYVEAREAWTRVRDDLGIDTLEPADDSEAAYKVWRAEHDRLCNMPTHRAAADASNAAHVALGAAYNAIFACPAGTLAGVILKFEAYSATRDAEGNGSHDLTCFEEPLGSWLRDCRLDLYRMAGAS